MLTDMKKTGTRIEFLPLADGAYDEDFGSGDDFEVMERGICLGIRSPPNAATKRRRILVPCKRCRRDRARCFCGWACHAHGGRDKTGSARPTAAKACSRAALRLVMSSACVRSWSAALRAARSR